MNILKTGKYGITKSPEQKKKTRALKDRLIDLREKLEPKPIM